MKITKVILFFASAILLFGACSPRLSPFTQNLYETNKWSEEDLKRIQFYLSDDVVLRRQVTSGSSEIISGEIKMVDGKKLEEVVIPDGTPGVLIFKPKEKRFAISFELGADERFLMFGPNPKRGNRYVLLASDWKSRRGQVQYDGKTFYTDSDSALASLLVDLKKVRKVSVDSRKARGRTVN